MLLRARRTLDALGVPRHVPLALPLILSLLQACGGASSSTPSSSATPGPPGTPDLESLLAQMTLAEKVGQMTQADRSYLRSESDIASYFLGSVLSGGGSSPPDATAAGWAEMYDRYQGIALGTRLRIPIVYGIDAVHGHNNVVGAVIFPHNVGLGCTRDAALVERVARATAEEVTATGLDWTFSPCIAVARDERWGRTYESFGETPELAVELGAAAVRGYQTSILACAKHYLADGGTAGGRDQGDARIDEATLRETHLPGFRSAVAAGVGTVIVSFSSGNGQKMHGNRYLLTDVLKGELGFPGFLVSDWGGVDQLPGDYAAQVETAVNAGIDMVMVPDRYPEFISTLKGLVQSGRVPQSRIDDAVRRILRKKIAAGLFDRPYADRTLLAQVGSDAHRQLAREAVRRSLVLLRNEGHVLPLSKMARRVHVAGRNADDLRPPACRPSWSSGPAAR
jgi:beta-glucosidase